MGNGFGSVQAHFRQRFKRGFVFLAAGVVVGQCAGAEQQRKRQDQANEFLTHVHASPYSAGSSLFLPIPGKGFPFHRFISFDGSFLSAGGPWAPSSIPPDGNEKRSAVV